ncbi:MAG: 50S ribosomal protein L4 [Nanoarchaeota archaeon]|nr:50S ribosomal protein L4 [Nanoarchaeota archaeon]|tara:strand:- start:31201 stop:32046 length:846 start_codon:yes stop_codon:yes gene_type:complete
MTTAKLYNIQGTEIKSIALPKQFDEPVDENLIKRAVLVLQQNKRQKYGALKTAGMRSSANLSRRRKDYRGGYGRGMSRVPRKVMWRRGTQFSYEGAFVSGTKGGRKAHPSKPEKNFEVKINKKERRKAIRSAISATLSSDLVSVRHKLPKVFPLITEAKIETFNKTKQLKDLLIKLGLESELKRISKKTIRAGKGTKRNRKYKTKKGPLIITAKVGPLEKASKNLPGIEFSPIDKINAEILAPGTTPGRLVIWSESALERLEKEKLFTNSPVYLKKEKANE